MEDESSYDYWRFNVKYLYDYLYSEHIDWSTMTCQFLPGVAVDAETGSSIVQFISGTSSSQTVPNYIHVVQVMVPRESFIPFEEVFTVEPDELPCEGYGKNAQMRVVKSIKTPNEVNKVRYCPAKPNLVAGFIANAEVQIYDLSIKSVTNETPSHSPAPVFSLTGHIDEGFGLSWSNLDVPMLVSGGNDGRICVWDVSAASRGVSNPPLFSIDYHQKPVEDVQFHPRSANVLASVADDGKFCIWDLRVDQYSKPRIIVRTSDELNTVAWNNFRDPIVSCSGKSKDVFLYDTRNCNRPLHAMKKHDAEIITSQWSPYDETVLVTADISGNVFMWDISAVKDKAAENSLPELIFAHGGHESRVNDISFSPDISNLVMTCEDERVVQLWQPSSGVLDQINPNNWPLVVATGTTSSVV
ncbi:hypothetical protein RCL1_001099 [Eukaryota sp. TZLM3-RCL]